MVVLIKHFHSFLPPPPLLSKGGGNQDFQQDMLVGKIFSEILVGEQKGGIQRFVVGETCRGWSIIYSELQK